jgi:hypothetical protein
MVDEKEIEGSRSSRFVDLFGDFTHDSKVKWLKRGDSKSHRLLNG